MDWRKYSTRNPSHKEKYLHEESDLFSFKVIEFIKFVCEEPVAGIESPSLSLGFAFFF